MIDPGPGPLGLCPVRGIVEVEQDSSIWLANTGSQPIQIALTSAPILGFPREDGLWYLDTDATDVEREQCCPKFRTKRNGPLPMSASRWREANRDTARPEGAVGGDRIHTGDSTRH